MRVPPLARSHLSIKSGFTSDKQKNTILLGGFFAFFVRDSVFCEDEKKHNFLWLSKAFHFYFAFNSLFIFSLLLLLSLLFYHGWRRNVGICRYCVGFIKTWQKVNFFRCNAFFCWYYYCFVDMSFFFFCLLMFDAMQWASPSSSSSATPTNKKYHHGYIAAGIFRHWAVS